MRNTLFSSLYNRFSLFYMTVLFLLFACLYPSNVYAAKFSTYDEVEVYNTSGVGLNLRSSYSTTSSIVTKMRDGTKMTVYGGPYTANGYTWWYLYGYVDSTFGYSAGYYYGYAAEDWLKAVSTSSTKSDLVIQNLSVSPSSGAAGTSATVSFTVRNQGSGSSNSCTTNIRFNTSSSSVSTSDTLLKSVSTPSISAGSTYSVSESVTIPSSSSGGTYYIWVIADINSTANQSDETNDKAYTSFTIPTTVSQSDLVIQNLSVSPSSGSAGSSATVSFTIYNQGNGTANSSTTNIRINSSSSSVSTSDTLLTSISTSSISSGGTSYVNQSVTIPSSLSSGNTYYIWVIVDVNSTANQSDETNDKSYTSFTVPSTTSYKSDLVIQNLSVSPNSGSAGSSATVSFTIYNQGNGSSNSCTTNIRFNTSSSSVTTSDTLLKSVSISSISAGSTYSVSESVTIPSSSSSGTYYYIWVIADVNSTANQSDETNDKANTSFYIEESTSSCTDSYEPNDSSTQAYGYLTSGSSYSGMICSGSDVDWFKVNITTAGTISVNLTVPSSNDYYVELYGPSYTWVAGYDNGGTGASESISYSATTTGNYYIRVLGYNGSYNITSSYTLTYTFTPSSTPTGTFPTVTTGTYQTVSSSSVQLFGTVNPNGLSTTGWFEWGTTSSYGNTTNTESLGSGTSVVQMLHTISGLSASTTYHFRAVGQNSAGTRYGEDMSFTTSATAATKPTVTTDAATSITSTAATLNGTVNPNRAATTGWFEWGTTSSYGNTTQTFSGGSGTSDVTMSWSISGLSSGTTYHYRTVAENSAGTSYGSDVSFTTSSCTYSINPTSKSITSSGGSGSVSVTTSSGCNWTATSNVIWITITSGSSGSGNGTVNYSISVNTGASSRTGTMTIEGQTFTITQDKASPTPSTTPTPSTCSDSYEPNDSSTQAYGYLISGSSYSGKICSGSDVDWFKVNITTKGTISLNLTVPSSKDYDLELYDPSYAWIAGSYSSSTSESISKSITTTGNYYIRISGSNESYSTTSSYALAYTFTPISNDITKPTGSITINSGASYTKSTTVTLSLTASDNIGVTGYYLSTVSTKPSSGSTGWTSTSSTTSYSANVSYALSSGDGSKTVYVWYKDAAGNVSDTASDSITLDTTAPTPSPTPTTTAVPTPSPTTSPAEEDLLEKYAPILYMHEDEDYHPKKVEEMLENSDLYKITKEVDKYGGSYYVGKKVEKINGKKLKELSFDILMQEEINNELHYLKLKKKPSKYTSKEGQTVYARKSTDIDKDGKEKIILQYWVFYIYNDWGTSRKLGNYHEGDWEMIQIILGKDDDGILQLEKYTYSYHHSGQKYELDKNIDEIDPYGNHPKVFVTLGGHGCWNKPGNHTWYQERALDCWECTDETNKEGDVLYHPKTMSKSEINEIESSAKKYAYAIEDMTDLEKNDWIYWKGYWGEQTKWKMNNKEDFGKSGPASPPYIDYINEVEDGKKSEEGRWYKPLEWANNPKPSNYELCNSDNSKVVVRNLNSKKDKYSDYCNWTSDLVCDNVCSNLRIVYSEEDLQFDVYSLDGEEVNLKICRYNRGTGKVYEVEFDWLEIPKNGKATLRFSPDENPNLEMEIDHDHDGISDYRVSPNYATQNP